MRYLLSLLLLAPALLVAETPAPKGPERWNSKIAEMEAARIANPPIQGSIVFVGSSSIVKWDLDKSWPGKHMVNSGFGGSKLPDSVHFFDRIVTPVHPRAVVVYAGDNDIAGGGKAEDVVTAFRNIVAARDRALASTPLFFVSIKPSIKRWTLWPEMKKANEAIAALCKADQKLYYIDIATPTLPADGSAPAADLFAKDGLHLSDKGYEVWKEIVEKALREADVDF